MDARRNGIGSGNVVTNAAPAARDDQAALCHIQSVRESVYWASILKKVRDGVIF